MWKSQRRPSESSLVPATVAVVLKLWPWVGSGVPLRMMEWAAQNSWVT